nr:MAG TPA: hypothetical protein [Bacteriophage sp.]
MKLFSLKIKFNKSISQIFGISQIFWLIFLYIKKAFSRVRWEKV